MAARFYGYLDANSPGATNHSNMGTTSLVIYITQVSSRSSGLFGLNPGNLETKIQTYLGIKPSCRIGTWVHWNQVDLVP